VLFQVVSVPSRRDRDVAAPLRVHQRSARLGRRHHVHDGGQRLPLDLDGLQRVLGLRPVGGHHHGHDLADVAGAVLAQRVLRSLAQIEADGGGEPGRRRAEER
jgi:hypothetical protein